MVSIGSSFRRARNNKNKTTVVLTDSPTSSRNKTVGNFDDVYSDMKAARQRRRSTSQIPDYNRNNGKVLNKGSTGTMQQPRLFPNDRTFHDQPELISTPNKYSRDDLRPAAREQQQSHSRSLPPQRRLISRLSSRFLNVQQQQQQQQQKQPQPPKQPKSRSSPPRRKLITHLSSRFIHVIGGGASDRSPSPPNKRKNHPTKKSFSTSEALAFAQSRSGQNKNNKLRHIVDSDKGTPRIIVPTYGEN